MKIEFDFRWSRWAIGYWLIGSPFSKNRHTFYLLCLAISFRKELKLDENGYEESDYQNA